MAQKTVLITGCSAGGIGEALAKAFHKRGLRVFATARTLAKVEQLRDLGMDVIQLDVVNEKSIQQAVEEVRGVTGGKLDFLVNNSGGGDFSDLSYFLKLADKSRLQSAIIGHRRVRSKEDVRCQRLCCSLRYQSLLIPFNRLKRNDNQHWLHSRQGPNAMARIL